VNYIWEKDAQLPITDKDVYFQEKFLGIGGSACGDWVDKTFPGPEASITFKTCEAGSIYLDMGGGDLYCKKSPPIINDGYPDGTNPFDPSNNCAKKC
jgi:hypothetical protein